MLAQSCPALPIPCPNKWLMVAIPGLPAERINEEQVVRQESSETDYLETSFHYICVIQICSVRCINTEHGKWELASRDPK